MLKTCSIIWTSVEDLFSLCGVESIRLLTCQRYLTSSRGNAAVMAFADGFLEPNEILNRHGPRSTTGKLDQPTVSALCSHLTAVAKEAVQCYLREDGMDEVAYSRLEFLLFKMMDVLSDHGSLSLQHGRSIRTMSASMRKRHVEEETVLRRVVSSSKLTCQ